MYARPSASHIREPSALRMKRGEPPTALNARTGELTPPGMSRRARANSSSDCVTPCSCSCSCTSGPSLRPSHKVFRVIREDDVRPRARDGGERLHHHALLVDPPPLGGG